ncbi:AI-2E family transporter [Sphingobacteriaceae bacterium]|nr:AI-2E family transporter [Sphingobacteriaceae bacterium]
MIDRLPLYLKLSTITMGLLGFFYILFIGQDILIPLTFSWIIAILLNPLVNFFCRRSNRIIAISLAIIVMCIIVGGILFFIGSQVSMFSDSFPALKKAFNEYVNQGLTWFSHTFNVGKSKVNSWIAEQKAEQMHNAGGMITNTVTGLGGAIVNIFLIPIYIFLFLFYKPLLLDFVGKLFDSHQHKVVAEVLSQTRVLIQNYLVGLLLEMVIVAAMNSTALLIIGIKYAVLLGVIGAILNLIPYIGGIVAIALPMIMGLITDDPSCAFFVLIAYIIIQIIDNNFLVPMIVASKVKVNALVSIIVVLIGGALWGVAGMFLSIPLTAIAKVIFDRVDKLKPFGFLIGDTMPDIGKAIFHFNRIKKEPKPVIKPETETLTNTK